MKTSSARQMGKDSADPIGLAGILFAENTGMEGERLGTVRMEGV
jgi:hypothetical protein